MAIPGFNQEFYLNAKLAQLQSNSETAADWAGKDAAFLEARFTAVGLTAEQHYEQYGYQEDLAPNAFFDPAEYIRAKATAMFNDSASSYLTIEAAAEDFVNLWDGNVYNHYLQYGEEEGINPSNDFDVSSYLEAKLAKLQSDEATAAEWADKGVSDVADEFEAAGITALEHFVAYGDEEGLSATAVPAEEQVEVDTSVPGQVFSLTTGADNITGTANNDSINASLAYESGGVGVAATSTLSVADIINGGAGTDSLNVTITGGNATTTFAPAAITNVENLFLRNVSGQENELDASTISGLSQVWADRSTSLVDVDNIASGATAGVKGNGTVVVNALEAGYVAGATASSLAVDGGTKAGANSDVTITGTGITSATISSTGAANSLDIVTLASNTKAATINATTDISFGAGTAGNQVGITGFAADSKLTINGAGAVNLETLAANVDEINASANTGGVTVALDAEADTKFVGGSGNDTVSTGAVLTTGSVDAGAGSDRLIITNSTHVNSSTLGAKYTGFETARVAFAGDQDVSLLSGITAVELGVDDAGATKMTAVQAAAVTNLADNTTANTLALADATGSSDVLGVTLKNATATASADLTNVTANGFETVNVDVQSGNAADTTLLGFAAADKLGTLNIKGTAPLSLSLANVTPTVVNAADLAGKLTITAGATKGVTVTGTANGDDVTAGTVTTGTATYNLGAGDDSFTVTAAQLNGSNVFDGGAGTDTVKFAAAAVTLVDSNFQQIKNAEVIDLASTTQDNSITTGGFFDANFASAKVVADNLTTGKLSVDAATYSKAMDITTVATSDSDQTITTGSGADKVTLDAGSGAAVVSTGAGSDTISVTTTGTSAGDATITAGAGKDTISITAANVSVATNSSAIVVNVGAGDSTVAEYDSITGFDLGTAALGSSTIDFAGTATVAANQSAASVTGFTSAELTYSISNGVLTFAGSNAATITNDTVFGLLDGLVTADTSTVAYVSGGNTYVFNENSGGDSLVELVGVSATSVATTNADIAGLLAIA